VVELIDFAGMQDGAETYPMLHLLAFFVGARMDMILFAVLHYGASCCLGVLICSAAGVPVASWQPFIYATAVVGAVAAAAATTAGLRCCCCVSHASER
jgi:hypothetical protein